mmetsp:Transcript_50794/g.132044  ORF Transcript_50794/g.132044 Transcript_50794/m.132044 type:complete len:103 (+) Transcript_50794:195-503(+)
MPGPYPAGGVVLLKCIGHPWPAQDLFGGETLQWVVHEQALDHGFGSASDLGVYLLVFDRPDARLDLLERASAECKLSMYHLVHNGPESPCIDGPSEVAQRLR